MTVSRPRLLTRSGSTDDGDQHDFAYENNAEGKAVIYNRVMGINYSHAKSLSDFIATRYTVDENGCWLWKNALDRNGYGRAIGKWYRLHCKSGAHQLSFIAAKGPIPDGMIICHTCDVRHCINPDHLYAGTCADNVQDCVRRGRYKNGSTVRRRFSNEQVVELRQLRQAGWDLQALGDRYGMSFAMAGMIARGESYRDVPCQ